MPTFEATMRVVHMETWCVEAGTKEEAREKLSNLTADVDTDEAGGEVVDWEVYNIKQIAD